MDTRRPFPRTRWAAIGAAVAVSLGAGAARAASAGDAGPTPPPKLAFVAIEPCRLFDTRPGAENVGTRKAPLGPGDTHIQTVVGTNGNCVALPANAAAVAMNVTTVTGTADSYLTVYPADGPRPLASNLNWTAGAPANPNKVDVKLSSSGQIALFNFAGTVEVLADVVGYYLSALPTAAFAVGSTTATGLSTTPTNIVSTAVAVKAPGTIVANATVTALSVDDAGVACSLSVTATYDPNRATAFVGPLLGGNQASTIAAVNHIKVASGVHTVSLMCRGVNATAGYTRPQISLVFLPD